MNELGELLWIGFVKRIEIGDVMAEHFDQAVVDLLTLVWTESPLQHLFRVVETAFDHELAAGDKLDKVFENTFSLVRSDGGNTRDFAADGLHFLLREPLDQIRAGLFPQNDEQNRSPTNSRGVASFFPRWTHSRWSEDAVSVSRVRRTFTMEVVAL